MSLGKKAMILGGNGALGKAMVNTFKQRGWRVLNIDLEANVEADSNLLIDTKADVQSQIHNIYDGTESFSKEYGSIICVAGGFQIAHIQDNDILEKYHEIDK